MSKNNKTYLESHSAVSYPVALAHKLPRCLILVSADKKQITANLSLAARVIKLSSIIF